MDISNILEITSRQQFRDWLLVNSEKEKFCWLKCKRGRQSICGVIRYLDAVEEALCFGWIDSTIKTVNGESFQRFSPRQNKSPWTELNKERCRRLIKLGLMTEAGSKVLPDLNEEFEIEDAILTRLKVNPGIWGNFNSFHPLYQRVRIDNLIRPYRKGEMEIFNHRLEKFLEATEKGKMIGDWNDEGRLIDY